MPLSKELQKSGMKNQSREDTLKAIKSNLIEIIRSQDQFNSVMNMYNFGLEGLENGMTRNCIFQLFLTFVLETLTNSLICGIYFCQLISQGNCKCVLKYLIVLSKSVSSTLESGVYDFSKSSVVSYNPLNSGDCRKITLGTLAGGRCTVENPHHRLAFMSLQFIDVTLFEKKIHYQVMVWKKVFPHPFLPCFRPLKSLPGTPPSPTPRWRRRKRWRPLT